jgi:cellulose synthase/poly-beta-1,6-N-acetylglucosamine synthase-like glycosyltransferase
MKISIIIPAWHEEKEIVRTLDSLKQLNYLLKECELIIAASSDDNTYSIAKGKNMHEFGRYLVLKQSPGGKNAALQQGIKESKGEIIVLLDADTLVDKDWLAEILKPLTEGYYCINGNWLPIEESWLNKYLLIERIWGRRLLKQQSTSGGGGIAFKRQLLNEIGINNLFNKNIYAGVDHHFGEQLIKRNYKIYFAEKAKTRTYYNKTLSGFIKDALRWKKAYSSQISKWQFFKILIFNFFILASLSIFFLAPVLKYNFLFYLPFIVYSFYLLFQCIASAFIDSKIGLLFYFPFYLLVSIIDRILTLYILLRKLIGFDFQQKTHFKGERYN